VDPPPEPGDGGPSPPEAGQLKAPRFPNAADLAGLKQQVFEHSKGSPAPGPYGDLANDEVWRHYQEGRSVTTLPQHLRAAGEGGRGVIAQPVRARPAASSHTISHRFPSRPGLTQLVHQRAAARSEHPIDLCGRRGVLHLAAVHQQCWNTSLSKLKIPPAADGWCQLPIFMLSFDRGRDALLDLGAHFPGQAYFQVVCINPRGVDKRFDEYLGNPAFEDVSFFVYPALQEGETACPGYSRFWVHQLAAAISPSISTAAVST